MMRMIVSRSIRHLLNAPTQALATKKPIKQPNIVQQPASKLDPTLHIQQIYLSQKTKPMAISSLLFLGGLSTCTYIFYMTPTLLNLVPFGITLASTLFHQYRIMNTAKSMSVDKMGTKLTITNYGALGMGLFAKSTIVPIHLMRGIGRQKINGGVVVRGGGVFGVNEFRYYLHEQAIKDKQVFMAVVNGKEIKYGDGR